MCVSSGLSLCTTWGGESLMPASLGQHEQWADARVGWEEAEEMDSCIPLAWNITVAPGQSSHIQWPLPSQRPGPLWRGHCHVPEREEGGRYLVCLYDFFNELIRFFLNLMNIKFQPVTSFQRLFSSLLTSTYILLLLPEQNCSSINRTLNKGRGGKSPTMLKALQIKLFSFFCALFLCSCVYIIYV